MDITERTLQLCNVHVTSIDFILNHPLFCKSLSRFPFSDPDLPTTHSSSSPTPVPVLESGSCHGVVVWWDIDLGGSTLTMDPWNYQQWRDHWLQAVFLWPQPVAINKGKESVSTRECGFIIVYGHHFKSLCVIDYVKCELYASVSIVYF